MENVPIYKIQKMMGHSSVATTEVYAEMELKRLGRDFPSISDAFQNPIKYALEDTQLEDTGEEKYSFVEDRMMN